MARGAGRSWGRPVRRWSLSLAAVLLAATSCSAFSGEPVPAPHDGPLLFGGDDGTLCVPAGSSPDYTYGFDALDNQTDGELTLESVRLVGASNLSLVGAGHVAPIEGLTVLGAIPGWPPASTSTAFERRRALPVVVAPQESLNLLLHVRVEVPARFEAVEVTYTGAGRARTVRNSTAFEVRDRCF